MKLITEKLSGSVDKFIEDNEKIATIIFMGLLLLKLINFNDSKIESQLKKAVKK